MNIQKHKALTHSIAQILAEDISRRAEFKFSAGFKDFLDAELYIQTSIALLANGKPHDVFNEISANAMLEFVCKPNRVAIWLATNKPLFKNGTDSLGTLIGHLNREIEAYFISDKSYHDLSESLQIEKTNAIHACTKKLSM